MITRVIMKRQLFDCEISQQSDNSFFSATDLVRAGNKWRVINGLNQFNMSEWLRQKGTKEFVKSLSDEYGEVIKSGKGRGKHTWVHPYLFIDMALSINPNLKLTVYEWIYDNLIKYRNHSGDSYKKMTGALYISLSNKSNFQKDIIDIANKIKLECNVTDWQTANENQLKLRDKIHEYISLLSDIIREKNNLIEVAIKKAKNEIMGE
jgi:hypothetical protein